MRDAATDDSNQRLTNEQPTTGDIVLWLDLAQDNQQDQASVRASVPPGAEITAPSLRQQAIGPRIESSSPVSTVAERAWCLFSIGRSPCQTVFL
jgi:hypothetical protein